MIRRSTLIVLLILAGLAAVAIYLQRSGPAEDAQPTPVEASGPLFQFDSQIIGLRLEKAGGDVLDIGRDDQGLWKLNYPQAEATDSAAVDSAVSQLLSTQIVSTLENGPSLEDAGLAQPAFRLLLQLEGGAQELISVGNESPTGSGYYVLVGNRGLMIVNKYSLDPLLALVETPPVMLIETPDPAILTPESGVAPTAIP